MARPISLAVLGLGALAPGIAPATAQAAQAWTWESRLTVAAAAINEETVQAPAGEILMADGTIVVSREDVLDTGVILTWRGEARLQRDARKRPAFAGSFGTCAASLAMCPRVADGAGFRSPVSAVTGLSAGGSPEDRDWVGAIEGASLSVSGSWGEGVLGLDTGVAARLDARPPRVLEQVAAASATLDPTGLAVTRARNDVTGPSAKVSYMSPRLLGLRAGVSWTPEARQGSVEYDPTFDGSAHTSDLAAPQLENVWEGALSFARQFPQAGVRIRAGLTATLASSRSRFTEFGTYEAYGAGLEVEKGGWTGGVRWLGSNNAWTGGTSRPGGAGYEAWEAGLVHQGDSWRFGIEGGWSRDKLTGIEGASWLAGASRKLTDSLTAGVGWMQGAADLPRPAGLGLGHINARNHGLIVELTVRN